MSVEYKIDPREFDVDFMRSHGYKRKQCKLCGSFFWTKNPDVDVCGEPPCASYSFLKSPPTKGRFSVRKMREAFLKFFESNGHMIIKPYPVVSRWRDDLLITIASIADFQPFVTSGISEPPANPLVISQPCLRFEDIHNVGLTAGRHLTIFEMGGAHAFNKKDKWVYWKNETIEFHHRFATEVLGIPEEQIIYKEHFWVGGGNAGPDLEGIINGLEVSTLVFMKYKVIDGDLVETPILTVDTGYGIERWAWLSTGSPTAFHTIYENLANDILKWAGITLEDEVIYRDTLSSGGYSAKNVEYIINVRNKIADEFGYDRNTLNDMLNTMNQLFAVLDHLKGAIFLIKDGAMPSNVKEGYLTRLLLRRCFRILSKYNLLDNIDKLIKRQIELWGKDFSEIRELEDVIFEIILLEHKKYLDIIEKGKNMILNILRKKGSITLDDLILLYDSHGLPPDYVAEVASEHNVKVTIPEDFHSLVASRHQQQEQTITKKESGLDVKFDTKRVYYDDMYAREIDAKVLWVKDNMVVLDKTVFYPEGGGQLGDTGWLFNPSTGQKTRVVDTQTVNGSIIHITNKPCSLRPGDRVKAVIDWDRRYSLMRTHTATHIILAAAKRVLGKHVWQTGAEKNPEYGRLDITHYKSLTEDEVTKIEQLANQIISRGIDVEIMNMERGDAERIFGPQIYQGGMVPGKYVRVVKIGDWDVEACGGLHVSNTQEILLIKIVGVEKIHEGVIRLVYKTGFNALREFQEDFGIISKLTNMLAVSKRDLIQKVESLIDENRRLKSDLRDLRSTLLEYKARELYEAAPLINSLKLIVAKVDDINEAIEIGEFLEKQFSKFILVGYAEFARGFTIMILVSKDARHKYPAHKIGAIFRGYVKGGGKGDERYYRFGGPGKFDINLITSVVKEYVKKRGSKEN